jgi:integrase
MVLMALRGGCGFISLMTGRRHFLSPVFASGIEIMLRPLRTATAHMSICNTNRKTPTAQRNFKKALRGFVDYCLSHHLMKDDPLEKLKMSKLKKTGGHHTWTQEEIKQYRDKYASGTKQRLAFELLLNTGDARADVVRMGRQHMKGGKLSMRRKTGVAFDIPLLPELVAEIALHPKHDLAFLVSEHGTPYTAESFGNRFRMWCKDADITGCTPHGLRKSAAVQHAMNGATAPELMAWFGWRSIEEAQRYVEEANRIRLAESAANKMLTAIGNPTNPVAKIGGNF